MEGPARERPAGPYEALDLDRHVLGKLLDGELRAEVVRDRVEAAGMDDPRPGLAGRGVVADVHEVDELRLAGEVDVVASGLGAGCDDRVAVVDVGADRRDHHPRLLGDLADRRRVIDVGVEERDVGERRVGGREALANALELSLVATRESPPRRLGRVRRQVVGRQLAGESGGSEEDDVVRAIGGHGQPRTL